MYKRQNPYTPIKIPQTNKVNVPTTNNLQWLLIGIVIGLCIALIPLVIMYSKKREVKPLVQERIDISEEIHESHAVREKHGEEDQE